MSRKYSVFHRQSIILIHPIQTDITRPAFLYLIRLPHETVPVPCNECSGNIDVKTALTISGIYICASTFKRKIHNHFAFIVIKKIKKL